MLPRSVPCLIAAPFILIASSCEDALSPHPPAAADVSGFWVGTWTEQGVDPDPGTGQISLSFAQEANGVVSGVVTFEGISCLETHPFVGSVSGLALDGMAQDEGVQVSFEVDASETGLEMGNHLPGIFLIDLGEDCAGLEGEFDAAPAAPATGSSTSQRLLVGQATLRKAENQNAEVSPSILRGVVEHALPMLPPPAVDVSGSWEGMWAEQGVDQDSGAGRISLSFAQEARGGVSGLVTFEGISCLSTHPFTGWVTGLFLAGTALDEGVRVSFEVDGADATGRGKSGLAGDFIIELGEGCAGLKASFVAAPEAPDAGATRGCQAPGEGD